MSTWRQHFVWRKRKITIASKKDFHPAAIQLSCGWCLPPNWEKRQGDTDTLLSSKEGWLPITAQKSFNHSAASCLGETQGLLGGRTVALGVTKLAKEYLEKELVFQICCSCSRTFGKSSHMVERRVKCWVTFIQWSYSRKKHSLFFFKNRAYFLNKVGL